MSEKIKLVQGDTRPALVCTITDDITGAPVDISGVTNGPAGQVAFYPASAPEMLQGAAGDYEGEIEITFADSQIQTVYDLLKFKVREDF